MEVMFIDWGSIKSFQTQMAKLCTAAVHVSSIGTSQIYQTFLRDGAVHVNLGFVERERQKPFPLFMEQYMAEGAPYLRALYYNSAKRICGLHRVEVVTLLEQAVNLWQGGFAIPAPRGANLSPEGRLFQELCTNDCSELLMSTNPDAANTHQYPGICEW